MLDIWLGDPSFSFWPVKSGAWNPLGMELNDLFGRFGIGVDSSLIMFFNSLITEFFSGMNAELRLRSLIPLIGRLPLDCSLLAVGDWLIMDCRKEVLALARLGGVESNDDLLVENCVLVEEDVTVSE